MGRYREDPLREQVLVIDSAVAEVFEQMLWQTCRVSKVDCGGAERIRACITLRGPHSARCCVELPVTAGDQVADALLGSEGDWDDELIEDAVGELCNMIAGRVKSRLGPERLSGSSLPEVVRVTGGGVRPRTGSFVGVGWRPVQPSADAPRRLYWIGECCTLAVTLELGDVA